MHAASIRTHPRKNNTKQKGRERFGGAFGGRKRKVNPSSSVQKRDVAVVRVGKKRSAVERFTVKSKFGKEKGGRGGPGEVFVGGSTC